MGTDRATRCRQPRCGSSGAVAVEAAVIGGADARVKPLCVGRTSVFPHLPGEGC